MQLEWWTAALPIAEMSAAVDAAAQWTPRTPLEALASVCICDEEDEDDYASDNWTAARSTLVAKSAKVQGAERVRVAGDAVVRGGAEIRGDAGPVAIGRYVDVGPRVLVHGGAGVGSHSLLQADAVIHDATIGVGCVIGKGAVIGSQAVLKDYCVVAAGAVVPEGSVLAPFSIVAGAPCRLLGEVSPAQADERRRVAELGAARRRAAG